MYRSHFNSRTRIAASPEVVAHASTAGQAHPDVRCGVGPAVPAPDRLTPLREVDSRGIDGHAGKVALYLARGPIAEQYVVEVEGVDGRILAMITAETRAEALDAYLHPFARTDVPDIFSEAA
jgi:hypothetical protein